MGAPTTVTATFAPMTNNLIFVTSDTFPANRGSAAAYDASCNAAATAAGINDAGGAGYIAMISDAASLGVTRLGSTARGWVRMDGLPFADTQTSLFTNNVVVNSIHYNETGQPAPFALAMIGTSADGKLGGLDCLSWTSNLPGPGAAGSGLGWWGGSPEGGSVGWVSAQPLSADVAFSTR